MPKLKPRKAVLKRFKITSKKKILRRKTRQNHFNARQTPKARRLKRNDLAVQGKMAENVLQDLR